MTRRDMKHRETVDSRETCTKCGAEPRRPGQRWGNACFAAAMREFRWRHRDHLGRLLTEMIAGGAELRRLARQVPPAEAAALADLAARTEEWVKAAEPLARVAPWRPAGH